ncbi:MAG: DUF2225 domain-containing protein [Bacteroidales bacterium]|nr:DUF2225 domain-containing protein [Bacteroidales bacterium]
MKIKFIYFLIFNFVFWNNIYSQKTELKNYVKNNEYNSEKFCELAYSYIDINIDSAKIFALEAIKLAKENNQNDNLIYGQIALGSVLMFNKNYLEALKYLLSAVNKIDNTKTITENHFKLYSNLGKIYLSQKQDSLALVCHNKAMNFAKILKNDTDIISTYNNFAVIYSRRENLSDALKFYNLAIEYINKHNIIYDNLPLIYLNIGYIYFLKENMQKAISYYNKAFEICTNTDNQELFPIVLSKLGYINFSLKNYSKAEEYIIQADSLYNNSTISNNKEDLFYLAYELYYETGNFEKAINYLNKYYTITDSMYSDELDLVVNDLKTKYEVEKITEDSKIKDSKIKEERKFNRILFGILLLILIILIFLAILIIQKNKLNQLLKISNNLLKETNKEINDNLEYAREIQSAMMKNNFLTNPKFDYFVFDRPKFKVGGDFYIIREKHNKIYFALADCTGHGISGGFISTLGYQYLSNAIDLFSDLNDILKILNINFYTNISQSESLCHESLCISIICIENNKISFAGSKHKLWLFNFKDNKLLEYSSNKQEIGISQNTSFDIKEFYVHENDFVFLSSDGLPDQFGKNGKIKYQQFREWLKVASLNSVEKSQNLIENNLFQWKQDIEQTDDILLIGIKF